MKIIARFLSNLLAIKSNEWEGVLYFFLVLLIFSFGASFARSIGTTLLIENLGGDNLPIIYILIDLSVMVGSMLYAHYTKKVSGLNILGFFLLATTVFSIFTQGLFFFNIYADVKLYWIYGFFFVGFSFFYILIFIHVGSVVASYFTAVQVKRVTGVINTGIPIGGILGGTTLVVFINLFGLEPQRLVLVLGVACLGSFGMLGLIKNRLTPIRVGHGETKTNKNPIKELVGAFKYIIGSRLMIFMSLGLMVFVIGNKLLEYQYQVIIYPVVYPDPVARTTFFATYEIFANLAWLIIQLFLTSRIILTLGVGASNLLHPILTGIAALGLFIYFYWNSPIQIENTIGLMLSLGIFTHFINQEMRGAWRTPVNNLLFNAIPPNQWGTNKAFLNGIVFPLSTVIAGTALLFLGENIAKGTTASEILSLPISYVLPLIAVVVSLLGIGIALPQWAAYNEGVFGLLNRELFNRHSDIGLANKGNNLKRVIEEKLASSDPYHVVAALEMIRVLRLNHFVNQVGNLLLKSNVFQIQASCINTLSSLPLSNSNITYLVEALRIKNDPEILPLILKNLALFKTINLNREIEKLLAHPSPEVFVEACLCLYGHPLYKAKPAIEKKILERLAQANKTHDEYTPLYLYALGELRQPHYSDIVLPFLDKGNLETRSAAFTAYVRMLSGQLEPYKARLVEALSSPSKEVKITALRALKECHPLEDWAPVIHLLGSRDRTLVNESKELLRLNLNSCKQSLIKRVFSEIGSVQERFEILSLIYLKLTDEQRDRLQKMARIALRKFVQTNGLLKIHQNKHINTKTRDLIAKILQEIAENHLLNVLTVITYVAEQNLEFFQRVSRGLLSPSRANQGNALEVLSNAGEKFLAGQVLKYFDERVNDIQGVNRIYFILFHRPLEINETNYESHLLALNHDMLRACLHYIQYEKIGRLRLGKATRNVRELLIETTNHHSKVFY